MSGTGYWVDYYKDAQWEYVAHHIEWQVRNGKIEVYLKEFDHTYLIEVNKLTENSFGGRIYDGDTHYDFKLRRISPPNWEDFTYYDYDDVYDYYIDSNYETTITLEGTWEGKMFLSSTWGNFTYTISYTQLYFNRDPYYYASGTGYWVDYYSDAPWDYVANHIEWQVRGGRIEVYLVEDNYTYFIEDYRLNDNVFRGRIYDNDTYLDFSMRHTSSPNWNSFDYYYYDDFYDYWYSNTVGFDGNENMRRSKKVVGAPHRNLAPAAVTAE